MNHYICEKCEFDNPEGSIFCQNCGEKLKNNKGLKGFLKEIDLGVVAGNGMKGVSIAPLFSDTVSGKRTSGKEQEGTVKIIRKKDGTFYCPYCGTFNKQHSMICSGCGKNMG
ncbi:MAG: hypothetical protein PUC12_12285 [Clostridiales bacterium]|nr:hypothetical protein [Clostridiales bacterium]